jgi:hypothetical protein
MKISILFGGIGIIAGVLFLLANCKGLISKTKIDNDNNQAKKNELKDNPYNELRNMALGRTAEEFDINIVDKDEVYGLIMDWNIGSGIVTLVTYNTGDASMYYSSGGGVIGGVQNENVNKAAKQLVHLANEYSKEAEKSTIYPLPEKECLTFYFLKPDSKYFKQEKIDNFENKSSKLLPMFEEANKVITELRLIVEKK